MARVASGALRHHIMRNVDIGEEVLAALDRLTSFDAIERTHEMTATWAEDVRRIANRLNVAGPPDMPEVSLFEQPRREVVATLRNDVEHRLAWLNEVANHA